MKPLRKLCCAVLLAATLPAWAALSREDAAALAQQQTGGRVLAVEQATVDGRAAWRVKVVTRRGEVLVLMLDTETGRPL